MLLTVRHVTVSSPYNKWDFSHTNEKSLGAYITPFSSVDHLKYFLIRLNHLSHSQPCTTLCQGLFKPCLLGLWHLCLCELTLWEYPYYLNASLTCTLIHWPVVTRLENFSDMNILTFWQKKKWKPQWVTLNINIIKSLEPLLTGMQW